MVKTRTTDNLVVVTTHGNGVFSGFVNSFNEIQSILAHNRNNAAKLNLFPNPASSYINAGCTLPGAQQMKGDIYIYNKAGKLVKEYSSITLNNQLSGNGNIFRINTEDLATGCYFCLVKFPDRTISAPFIVIR